MKKIFSFFMVFVLIISFSHPASAKDKTIYCYDFDLRFHLNSDEFPILERKKIMGYADLLNMLEFRGNLAWCPATQSMDLHLDLIPVSNPSAAISFRLYGVPDYMCLTSPLLESETIFLHNYALMEFAGKAWQTFHIPLPYLVLLDPYVTIGAFSSLVSEWHSKLGRMNRTRKVSKNRISSLAESWKNLVESDYRFSSWLNAATAPLPDSTIVEKELLALPDILLNITGRHSLHVTAENGTLICVNHLDQVLFEQISSEKKYQFSLTLPETGTNYIPALSYCTAEEDDTCSVSLQASWDKSPSVSPDSADLPESLLRMNLILDGIPSAFPADAVIHSALKLNGYALPNLDFSLQLDSSSDGKVFLAISCPVGDRASVSVCTCTGTVVPSAYEGNLKFKAGALSKNFNIFSVNDQTLYDFVHRTAKPLFTGLLNFLYEIPASSCQSIMDELEHTGILDLILK